MKTVPIERLRPVSSNIKITLSVHTIAHPMKDNDVLFIPLHKFELVDFEHLHNIPTTYVPHQLPTYAICSTKYLLP